MLILAGAVISLSIGENGIFKIAKYAVQKNSEETAREKLELELGNLQANKYTDETYNENDYIDDYLKGKNMYVVGDIVTVDGWKFEIDRIILQIKKHLGKSKVWINQEVKAYIGKNENEKYEVNILLTIESNKEIENIIIQKPDGTTFEIIPTDKKLKILKDMTIELDEEYNVKVKTIDGEEETLKILEKSVEKIRTAEELATFRDKVNTGLTYEGKTIEVVKDIDLREICYRVDGTQEKDVSWEPIGNYEDNVVNSFKGTFKGNYKTISNLYINSIDDAYQGGLFGYLEIGKIEEIVIKNSKLIGCNVGGIAYSNDRGTIYRCKIEDSCEINITPYDGADGIGGAGGIISGNAGKVEECINSAQINSDGGNYVYVGGITSVLGEGGEIINCYNTGTITVSNSSYMMVGGIVGEIQKGIVINCYNIGAINAIGYTGGLVGRNGYNSSSAGTIVNSYCTTQTSCSYMYYPGKNITNSYEGQVEESILSTYASILGNAFANDKKNENGIWKYNNGYPILKWQNL